MRVEQQARKWDGAPTWRFPLRRIGTDEHGTWLACDAGALLQRGSAPPIVLARRFVELVPHEPGWTARFYADAGGPDEIEVYCDVVTHVELGQERIELVDLDLDVIRTHEGRVRVLDEDEFAEHRVTMGYPDDVVEQARATAARLATALAARTEPFGSVAGRWSVQVRPDLAEVGGAEPV